MEELEGELKYLLKQHPTGLPDNSLRRHFGEKRYRECAMIIDKMIRQDYQLMLLQDSGGGHVYQLLDFDDETGRKLKSMKGNAVLLFQHICRAGSDGISATDLKKATNLFTNTTRLLSDLVKSELVKSIRPAGRRQAVYIMSSLTPSADVIGGCFHHNSTFNDELVKKVSKFCYEQIRAEQGLATLDKLTEKWPRSNIFRMGDASIHVALGRDEMLQVVRSLMYGGHVEEVSVASRAVGEKTYKLCSRVDPINSFTDTPCGVCPVMDQCEEGGPISPETCKYMDEWLSMF